MKNFKRIISAMLFMVVAVVVLAGCQQDQTRTFTRTKDDNTVTNTLYAHGDDVYKIRSIDKIKLDENSSSAFNMIKKSIEKNNKGKGITIKVTQDKKNKEIVVTQTIDFDKISSKNLNKYFDVDLKNKKKDLKIKKMIKNLKDQGYKEVK
ncbi:DUF1307 domain-containing protein [Lactobacillus sp. YT155]|uniref:DUF1307 domain-containing protein n=1 Tax=Lactobacillus sp. YT155 TaxID=3060955 RepID=UPI00265E6A05|nr:DUF1307 domain-containing protein [Lactobacillus sp. YT155]MDO1604511.1 DUF1307 domain-containing protein [Lactobacillus sp. YT155]